MIRGRSWRTASSSVRMLMWGRFRSGRRLNQSAMAAIEPESMKLSFKFYKSSKQFSLVTWSFLRWTKLKAKQEPRDNKPAFSSAGSLWGAFWVCLSRAASSCSPPDRYRPLPSSWSTWRWWCDRRQRWKYSHFSFFFYFCRQLKHLWGL